MKHFPEVKTGVFLTSVNCAGGFLADLVYGLHCLAVLYLQNLGSLVSCHGLVMFMSLINTRCSAGSYMVGCILNALLYSLSIDREFQALKKNISLLK